MHVWKLHNWKYSINMIKDTCLFPLVAAQSLLVQSPGDPWTAELLNNDNRKQEMQEN
jgi:hypothetical protein